MSEEPKDTPDYKSMNLYQKVLEVMKKVEYLQKDGEVRFGQTSYNYISETKVTEAIRAAMIEVGLVIIPKDAEQTQIERITYLDAAYKLVNVDDPKDYEMLASVGAGWDTQDKGPGKAMTYAYKYVLIRTFMIPSGEDPDAISSDEIDQREKDGKKNVADHMRPTPERNTMRLPEPKDGVTVKDAAIPMPEQVDEWLQQVVIQADLDMSLLTGVTITGEDNMMWHGLRATKRIDPTEEWRRYGSELLKAGFYSLKLNGKFYWVLLDMPSPTQAKIDGPPEEEPAEEVKTPAPEAEPEDPDGWVSIKGKMGNTLGRYKIQPYDDEPAVEIIVETEPTIAFTTLLPPFDSFLIERVFENMKAADLDRGEEYPTEWTIEEKDDMLTGLRIRTKPDERRHREITSSLRWTLDKMNDKLKQD